MGWSLWVGRYGSVAVSRSLWVGRSGSVAVGRSLWVSLCGWSLWIGCRGSSAAGQALWVGPFESVAVGSIALGCFVSTSIIPTVASVEVVVVWLLEVWLGLVKSMYLYTSTVLAIQ